ncbi:MAG TPA: DUF885 family protein, partial [Acidimicrobiales bacterium]
MTDTIRSIADEYWEAKLEASPLFASFLGDHRYDDRADDLSADEERRLRSVWAGLRERAAAVASGNGELDETDRASRDLLVQELDDSVRAIDLRLAELASDQMQGVHADLLITAAQLQAPDAEHAAMALTRARQFGRMLDQATDRYREGLAAGRPPVRINVERSINQVDG